MKNFSFINFLPPWVETNIQPAFYNKESGSVLQQTARMYAKVNQLVRHFNCLSKETKETVDEYIAKFVELKNFVDTYFENLDVQEEINNKLDTMAEDGTLQEIITTYIQSNVAWTFDSVADMKAATNLIDGSYARTLGYYSADDGGGAIYAVYTTEPTSYYETNGTLYYQLVENNAINFEMFGAKGDGTTDDTEALQSAINQGKPISCTSGKTYLINDNITLKSNKIDLNGSVIKSVTGNNLVAGSDTEFVNITNGELDGVGVLDTTDNTIDYYVDNLYMHDTDKYGLQIETCGKVVVTNSKFYEIGKGLGVNINVEACGIRVNGADYVQVSGNYFEKCHGTGAAVVRSVSKYDISHNVFYKNDYRGIATSSQLGEVCSGIISYNNIQDCGTYASHNTGVGCNGIYSNDYGDISDTVVSNNFIKNVCENGIEGAYGVVESNYVDGTGVDQTNHPTPSASGINMYGKIYRYNTVKNSYLAGMYVSGVTHSESTELEDKQIYGNTIGKSVHEPNRAIYVNGTKYTNIDIHDNVMDGYIETAPAAVYKNCRIGNNYNYQGKAYKNNFASYISDKGSIAYQGFEISGTTINNITTAGVTYTIDGTDRSVTFTSTGTNKAFSIRHNVSQQSLQCLTLFVGDDTSQIKVTVQGTKHDDTASTIASNRMVQVNGGIAGITTELDNTYKSITYLIYVEDNGNLKLNNIQTKEITM